MISLTKREPMRPGLLGIEKISIIYALFTLVVALLFRGEIPLQELLVTRLWYAMVMALLIYIYRLRPCHLTFFMRVCFQLVMTGSWYPETYLFCRMFGNFDPVFASIDQMIFSCQPALLFSEKLNNVVWSEFFNLGYFSYYPMIIALVVYAFFRHYPKFEKSSFIVLCSFFLFYIVFMFLPVAGPQYYYPAVGVENIRSGVFPPVGSYFKYHFTLMPETHQGGLFQYLVGVMHSLGERPTAAFPSSHVGVSTIVMILAWKLGGRRRLFYAFIPFYVLLCFSTVYIHAHYAIDAIVGFIVAPIVYRLCHALYYTKAFHRPEGFHS